MIAAVAPVSVTVDLRAPLNRIVPMRSIGAGLDAENGPALPIFYGHADVAEMLGAGLGPVTYRLYTELGVQDWHWNPNGAWSDPSGAGYWTGSATPGVPILASYGYRLPHRGDTYDQANNDGYSRIDDGDSSTYWKSDPYLAARFTGDPDSAHPQWVLVDLGARRGVDAARILWSSPYATAYAVQYWTGDDALYDPAHGRWVTFPTGTVTNGNGGTVALTLASAPVPVRYVRVAMTASSGTCDSHGPSDPRNCAGYAIAELGIGTANGAAFRDLVRHQPNKRQSVVYVSSTDPWHAAANRDTYDEVQPGLDAVFQSGITRGLPAFVAVSMLYGTPDDAAAEIAYLGARGDSVDGVELGEEPDGQFVSPEDDAALYVQWSKRLHAVNPALALGGPVFQGTNTDVQTWADASGNVSWLARFLAYLRAHGALASLRFMSFEHYPYDPCRGDPYRNIRSEPALASHILDVWRRDGVPANVPYFVTEMNYSADAGAVFQDVAGALWFADAAGAFLSGGANGVFLYQYAPEPLQRTSTECATFGSYGMFAGTPGYRVRQRTAQYFAAQLLMQKWAQPVDRAHELYATVVLQNGRAQDWVTAYAIRRPDSTYAVMLINKDPLRARSVTIAFASNVGRLQLRGSVAETVFGRAQYAWHGTGRTGFASPDGPAIGGVAPAAASYTLEPGSIVVLSGAVAR